MVQNFLYISSHSYYTKKFIKKKYFFLGTFFYLISLLGKATKKTEKKMTKRNKILSVLSAGLIAIASPNIASAACYGSYGFSSCYDSSGNSYSVYRIGNSSYMSGFNTNTGSSWSQNSTTIGGSTYHSGISSNGNPWSMTQTGNSIFGIDSSGNFFSSYD